MTGIHGGYGPLLITFLTTMYFVSNIGSDANIPNETLQY